MAKYILTVCALAIVGVKADDLSDFSNNLASDLGPLLSLFGDAITRQYLSESTSFLDYFIFAMAPIGIITTIVSVIRVCGSSSLRAFVGRAQEGEGVIEAELCTSTSRDVCELFNKGGITRVLGRPDILELVYLPREDKHSAKLHLFRRYLEEGNADTPWARVEHSFMNKTFSRLSSSRGNQMMGENIEFAPKPNLSLNVGIRKQPDWVFYAVAAIGLILQAAIMIFAGATVWIFEWNIGKTASEASKNYAPGIFIAGTIALCSGMWGCAALIGQTTDELYYRRKKKSPERLYWLQPGPQVIGDQSFDSFAYSDKEDQLMFWTSSIKDFEHNFQIHTFVAVLLVLLGYIAQFIGLRGLSSWVSIAQLGISLVMSMLRGALRMQRLNRKDNSLAEWPDLVAGHELDWLAFEIARHDSQEPQLQPQDLSWHITGQYECAIKVEPLASRDAQDSQNQTISPRDCEKSLANSSTTVGSPTKRPVDYDQLFLNRVRLAHLTGHFFEAMETEDYQLWKDTRVNVRANAKKLASAICQAAASLLQDRQSIKLGVRAVVPGSDLTQKDQLVHVTLKPPADYSQISWGIDSAQLESILGLWMWSLTFGEYIPKSVGTGKGISPNKKLNVETMRIISAGDTNIDLEMSFWLGSDIVRYLQKSLETESYKYSLFDLWKPKPDKEPKMERVANEALHQSPHNFQRFCGWSLVYDLLEDQPSAEAIQVQALKINPKECSLLDVCTQELFITLVRSLANFEWRNMDKTTVVESDGSIRLENQAIAALAKAFVDYGLGTHSHAMTCIVPPLRTRVFPQDEILLSALKRGADKYRQNGEWGRAEVVLRWACQHYFPPSAEHTELDQSSHFMMALRAIGELYRWSLSHIADDKRQQFGQDGIRWMEQTYGDSNVIVSSYKDIATKMSDYHVNHDRPQGKDRNESNFVSAIKDKRRTDALYFLCFIKTGDFASRILREALPLSVRNDWDEIMDAILEMKGSPNSEDEQGKTAASYCAEAGLPAQLRRLIHMGAEIDLADKRERFPLHWAALTGHEVIAKILLDTQQVDFNRQDKDNNSPLLLAIGCGHIGVAKQLLQSGADTELRGHSGVTPLCFAAETENLPLIELLLDNGAFMDAQDDQGATPLIIAVRKRHKEIVQLLLDKGADIEFKHKGQTPLFIAGTLNNQELLQVLLENGADIESIGEFSGRYGTVVEGTLLTYAAREGHEDIMRQLLEKGANIEAKDNNGQTALIHATRQGYRDIIRQLLEKGANIEAKDNNGQTALIYTIAFSYSDIVRQLLEKGANIEAKDNNGQTALIYTIAFSYSDIVRQLLEKGANIEAKDNNGQTAFIHATRQGYRDIIRQFLEKGANIEAKDNNGQTALIYTIAFGYSDIVQQLLEKGANIEAKDRYGNTALSLAIENGERNIVQLLRKRDWDTETEIWD